MHDCPCGCGARIASHMLSCKRSWFRLPKDLRQTIWNAWNNGDPDTHAEAVAEAIETMNGWAKK